LTIKDLERICQTTAHSLQQSIDDLRATEEILLSQEDTPPKVYGIIGEVCTRLEETKETLEAKSDEFYEVESE
jgi:hypothetical protein